MIQRKQSLYLLIAGIIYILLFFFPVYHLENQEPSQEIHMSVYQIMNIYTEDGEVASNRNIMFPSLIIQGFLIILAFLTIFLYQNRKMQLNLCRFQLLLGTALIVFALFNMDKAKLLLISKEGFSDSYSAAAILLIIPLLFLYLAIRGISKDEKMMQSADRLR